MRETTTSVDKRLQVVQPPSGRSGREAHVRRIVAPLVSGSRFTLREETRSRSNEIMASIRYVLFEEW